MNGATGQEHLHASENSTIGLAARDYSGTREHSIRLLGLDIQTLPAYLDAASRGFRISPIGG